MAAPVRDYTGAVVAALASSTSSARSTPGHLEKNVVPLLLETAASISTDLGHRRISNTHNAETRDGFF